MWKTSSKWSFASTLMMVLAATMLVIAPGPAVAQGLPVNPIVPQLHNGELVQETTGAMSR